MRELSLINEDDTFYISASGRIRTAVRKLAAQLPGNWHLGHDWTLAFGGGHRPSDQILAHLDLECAKHADYFVFLDSEHFSRGGMMEYGARLANGGTIHHIGCSSRSYMFFNIPQVIHYDSVEEFLEAFSE